MIYIYSIAIQGKLKYKYQWCGRQYGCSADRVGSRNLADCRRRHSEPPAQGSPPASSPRSTRSFKTDSIDRGVDKTCQAKHRKVLWTGAETASMTGPGAGTEPRTGVRNWGQALRGRPSGGGCWGSRTGLRRSIEYPAWYQFLMRKTYTGHWELCRIHATAERVPRPLEQTRTQRRLSVWH